RGLLGGFRHRVEDEVPIVLRELCEDVVEILRVVGVHRVSLGIALREPLPERHAGAERVVARRAFVDRRDLVDAQLPIAVLHSTGSLIALPPIENSESSPLLIRFHTPSSSTSKPTNQPIGPAGSRPIALRISGVITTEAISFPTPVRSCISPIAR